MNETAKRSGLYDIVSNIIPNEAGTVWSLVFFKILSDLAFVYAESWYKGNYVSLLHKEANISSQRISDFLKRLGEEKVLRSFFEKYLSVVADKECGVIIDSTGFPNGIDSPVIQTK